MITIIIFGLIGAFLIMKDYGYFDFDVVLLGFIGFLIGCIFGIFVAVILPAKNEITKTTYNLEALQDNNSVSGSFFLGSGQIEGKMKYVFYYEESDYYKMEQVDYDRAKIKYSDEKPKAELYKEAPVKNAFINYFAFDMCHYFEYVIYVPKGSIKTNYSLDAQ